jgi:flagellar basal-body rod modification protein FlgD
VSSLAEAIGVRAAETQAPRPARQTLGQEDFLTLLVAQLRNQDPLNPLDNEAFVAQLAQFATVSGITEISRGIGALSARTDDLARLQASALLGRTVTASDGTSGVVAEIALSAEGRMQVQLADGTSLPAEAISRIA